MAGIYNLKIDKGSYFSMVLEIEDEGLDLSGAVGKMQLRECPGCQLIVSADVSISQPNQVIVEMSAVETNKINGKCRYDLDIILPDGKILSILTGNVEIREKINQ